VRGIDISASGIAVAVGDEVALEESMELAIRSGANEVAQIPGRVFYQSENHFGLEFSFASEEQRRQVQELIARFLTTV
ncbi:MAG TPA: PilZ domain-containing protein, partial [Candidatus Angelobacter sp.]|nr:PilZ domain-containing protein [Candidatus Angelobacter sp.]